jgi:hypothetical protein
LVEDEDEDEDEDEVPLSRGFWWPKQRLKYKNNFNYKINFVLQIKCTIMKVLAFFFVLIFV